MSFIKGGTIDKVLIPYPFVIGLQVGYSLFWLPYIWFVAFSSCELVLRIVRLLISGHKQMMLST